MVILTHGRMPRITRRFRASSFEVFLPDGLLPLGALAFEECVPSCIPLRFWRRRGRTCSHSTFIVIVAETANVSSRTLYCCSPLVALSLFPFNDKRFPSASVFLPVFLSRFLHFWPQNCELSSSDPEISLPSFSISKVACWHIFLMNVLFVRCQHSFELVRLTYPHFVQDFRNYVRRYLMGRQ